MLDITWVKEKLIESDVKYLYHSNTVTTALTFIDQKGLLSRGAVEENKLKQTSQFSDNLDKKFGIWNDIFFDSVDIHKRSRCLNQYGPVLFIYSIDLLDYKNLPEVKVTKKNPIYWENVAKEERYFEEEHDFKKNYIKGDFGQHITLVKTKDIVPFDPYLHSIILDNPKLEDNSLFDDAKKILEEKLDELNINVPLIIRECSSECNCIQKYKQYYLSDALKYKFMAM